MRGDLGNLDRTLQRPCDISGGGQGIHDFLNGGNHIGIAPTGLGYALFFERDSKGDGHAIFWAEDRATTIF
jgi:hypothetical protein